MLRIRAFFTSTAWLTALIIIRDNQSVFIKHHALKTTIRTDLYTHLLTHISSIGISGKGKDKHRDPYPCRPVRHRNHTHCLPTMIERICPCHITDKGRGGNDREQQPNRIHRRALKDFARTHRLFIKLHALIAITNHPFFDILVQMRPNRLWTSITAPYTTCIYGNHKQRKRRNQGKCRYKIKVLRQKRHAKDIVVLRWHIKPYRLSVVIA